MRTLQVVERFLQENFHTLAELHGQRKSIHEQKSVDAEGVPVPWYTYPAIEYLGHLDFCRARIFEFGSGNSSLYWASRAAKVTSVEHDPAWYKEIKDFTQHNQQLFLRTEKEAYLHCLEGNGDAFDLIVIDGKWRTSCAALAADHLKEGGLILLDNSDWYQDAAQKLRSQGFFQIGFNGFGPINNYCWTTSLFLQANTLFQEYFQDAAPIGGRRIRASDDD